jgi:hypothetical protein
VRGLKRRNISSSQTPSSRRLVGITCAVALLLPSLAIFVHAQHGPMHLLCIDTLAINSKSILVGKIAEIHDVAPNVPDANVSVRVERWLKGGAGSDTIETRIESPVVVLTQFKDQGSRLLIFTGVDTIKVFHGNGNAIDLSSPSLILTADMKVLKDPEQILQATQKAIERYRGVSDIATFQRSLPLVS